MIKISELQKFSANQVQEMGGKRDGTKAEGRPVSMDRNGNKKMNEFFSKGQVGIVNGVNGSSNAHSKSTSVN
jgi:hypothetical protein